MNLSTKKYFDLEHLKSIDDVLESLRLLERDLPLMSLPYLRSFNHTYLIITHNVKRSLEEGVFDSPEFIDRFDGRFACYYTRALYRYLGKKPTPLAWQEAFDSAKQKTCSPLIAMALGVNAHVNNDIPQVLLDCAAEDKHYDDYRKVNKIIKSSIEEVVNDLDESGNLADPKMPIIGPLYKTAMDHLIRLWRQDAWNKFKDLKTQPTLLNSIEDLAHKKAKKLLMLPL